jgi:hypothetical protein
LVISSATSAAIIPTAARPGMKKRLRARARIGVRGPASGVFAAASTTGVAIGVAAATVARVVRFDVRVDEDDEDPPDPVPPEPPDPPEAPAGGSGTGCMVRIVVAAFVVWAWRSDDRGA